MDEFEPAQKRAESEGWDQEQATCCGLEHRLFAQSVIWRVVYGAIALHDGLPQRFDWLIKARELDAEIGKVVVIGVARHERENWALTGFMPSNEQEKESVADLRAELGFDPCREAHELTAKEDHEVRSAKRVLGILTQNASGRKKSCWSETPLATLSERGEATGLTAFLAEIEDRLVPLFSGKPFERKHPTH